MLEDISLISSSHILSPLLIGLSSLEAVLCSHVGKKDEDIFVAARVSIAGFTSVDFGQHMVQRSWFLA